MEETTYPKKYLYRRIVAAKQFIDQHYAQKIELDQLSEQACFSKYHFHRLFKNSYGLSPRQYLTQVRIQEAKKLLGLRPSIAEVCYEVGFESVPSFTHLFKRQVGCSPKVFAQQLQQKRQQQQARPRQFIPFCFAHKLIND